PLLGPATAAAEAAGVRPGMRLGEALSLCPELALVEQDPTAAEHEWEQLLQRLEDSGFAVEAAAVGCVYFETRRIQRLYGGDRAALRRARAGAEAGARRGRIDVGCAHRRRRPQVRGAGGRARRATGAAPDRLRPQDAGLPRATAADVAPGRPRAPGGTGGARGAKAWTACWATGRRRCRTFGAGRPAGLEPGERRKAREGPPAEGRERTRGDARVSRGSRERADAPAGAGCPPRPAPRPAGARRQSGAEARPVCEARRWRILAANGHVARCNC